MRGRDSYCTLRDAQHAMFGVLWSTSLDLILMTVNIPPTPTRRSFLAALATTIAGSLTLGGVNAHALVAQPAAKPASPGAPIRDIVVYKDPNCGCCKEWVKHIQKAGFVATVHDMTDMSTVKRSFGVPEKLESCHTARVGKYSIEGHVPADVMIKLLAEQPAGRGLAVPGMPSGSPGMEGGRKDAFDVLLFDAAGKTRVYASR